MKVLLINGSPHEHGCTARALDEISTVLNAEGIETETMQIGGKRISGCIACRGCGRTGRCVFDDEVNLAADKLRDADGLIVGSPVYFASPNGTLISFLDRLFYSASYPMQMKVGAAVVSCRRGGASAAFDVLNKYFMISGMPVASSTYWNSVHGFRAEDVEKDAEGLQTMRNIAHETAFMIKAIAAGKDAIGSPAFEHGAFTSFPDGK